MSTIIRIATRQSPLALWQAEEVARQLKSAHSHVDIELVKMVTQGDKILDSPLSKIGGKGLFVKELEVGMLEGRADIAVHSMKDVPMSKNFPEGLHLSTIMKRENPTDAFVSNNYKTINELPQGAVVGTSSLRRECQLAKRFPHLKIKSLRGNVNTRLAKLDDGEYDAIILASAGLIRLGFESRIASQMTPEDSLPAVGQGAVGIECRQNDDVIESLLAPLADRDTTDRVLAERAMNERLNGGCQVPIAGYALLEGDEIFLRGLIGRPDGSQMLHAQARGHRKDAISIGQQVGDALIEQGAEEILEAIRK